MKNVKPAFAILKVMAVILKRKGMEKQILKTIDIWFGRIYLYHKYFVTVVCKNMFDHNRVLVERRQT